MDPDLSFPLRYGVGDDAVDADQTDFRFERMQGRTEWEATLC